MKINGFIFYAILTIAMPISLLKAAAAERKVQYAEVAERYFEEMEAFAKNIEKLNDADFEALNRASKRTYNVTTMDDLGRIAAQIDPVLRGKPLILFRKLMGILCAVYQQGSENFVFVQKMLESMLYESLAREQYRRWNPDEHQMKCPKINDECAYRPFVRSFIKLYHSDFVTAHSLGIAIYALNRSVQYPQEQEHEFKNFDNRLEKKAQNAIDKYGLHDVALNIFQQYVHILFALYENNASEKGWQNIQYIAREVDGVLDREFDGISLKSYQLRLNN